MDVRKLKRFSKQGKEKIKDKNGYVLVYCPNNPFSKHGYVLEHRLIVESKINRILRPEETVHHLDHNRSNNDINNLVLFKNQKEHKSFENKVKQFGFTNGVKMFLQNRWEEFE